MKFKAVILDLDGTTIPNRKDGMPSKRVIDIIHQLRGHVSINVATGRGLNGCKEILKSLGLTSPCIVNGGTRIVDPVTEKIIWEKELDKSQVEKIMEVAKEYHYPVFFGDELEGEHPKSKIIKNRERIIYIEPVTKEDTEIILEKLSKIRDVTAHKVISWTPHHFDIHITHSEATKRHSLEILLEILKVQKSEVVAIGDSNNDLPLFELAGYKIAMENGSEELKSKADMVAPSVAEDGVAIALEKLFIQKE